MIDLGMLGEKFSDIEPVTAGPGEVSVFRARQTDLARSVLIRVLPRVSAEGSGEHEALFQRGAKAAAGLHHPHILQVLDYETTPAANLLILEDARGESLEAVLRREPALPVERALDITVQLTAALEHAHDRRRYHRNLRPGSVLIGPSGQVKLTGFEAAALPADPDDRWSGATLFGHALYLAPEQAAGQPVNARSDIYSLGVLLYTMLTGRPPFHGSRSWSVIYKKTHADPPPPSAARPGLPPAMDELVLGMLRRSPDDRVGSMKELRELLQKVAPLPPAPDPERTAAHLPFPIAHAHRLIGLEFDWLPRQRRLLYAFEAAIKLCAAIALFGRASHRGPLDRERCKLLPRPSLGQWVQLLRWAVQDLPAGALFERLTGFAATTLAAFDQAVECRNRFAHGGGDTESGCRKEYEQLWPTWQRVAAGLVFLADFPLGKVLRLNFTGGGFEVTYRSYMGDNPVFETATRVIGNPLESGRVGLFLPDDPGLLDLGPLVDARECEKCGDEEVFFYNGLKQARHHLISYQKGHEYQVERPADAFERRGLGW